MARSTKSQAEATIVDRAAALFAKHGFARTSLKLIAGELGYTNAGLLHHYPSKQSLYDAVLDTYIDQIRQSLDRAEPSLQGRALDRAFIEETIDFAIKWPGLSAFGVRLLIEENIVDPRFEELGLRLLQLVGIDLAAPDFDRLLRIHAAMTGINHNVRLARRVGLLNEYRDRIATIAMDSLGHAFENGASTTPADRG